MGLKIQDFLMGAAVGGVAVYAYLQGWLNGILSMIPSTPSAYTRYR